ncbi:MAG: BT_3928 family protein [Chitinophagales bacterium]
MKNSILWFCRLFVGSLFIFSGLIKANDPVGFGIKLEEYYEVFADKFKWSGFLFNADWLLDSIHLQAVFLTTIEVALGIALILGIWKNLVSWLLLLMILFFTWLTGFSAVTGSVTDCGCFGDAIPLTPWQSFYKDLILVVLIIIIFFMRKSIKPVFNPAPSFIIFVLVAGFTLWVNMRVLQHDVFIDFRPYAVGNNIPELMKIPADAKQDVVQMRYEYTNKKTGEKVKLKYLSTDLQDKTKLAELTKYSGDKENWKLDTSYTKIIEKGFRPKITDFAVSDESDNYITDNILSYPDYSFMFVSPEFDKTSDEGWEKINTLGEEAKKEGVLAFALVAESRSEIETFTKSHQTAFLFYTGDGKVCMTIGRTNPNIVLLKNGTVIDKWSWRDLPSFAEIKSKHFPERKPSELRPITNEMFYTGENVAQKLRAGKEPYNEFFMVDSTGTDVTQLLINDSTSVTMVIMNELEQDKLTAEKWPVILAEMKRISESGAHFFVVSSGSFQILFYMKKATGLEFNYYTSDKDVLHKIMKENSGIIKIENGVVAVKKKEGEF